MQQHLFHFMQHDTISRMALQHYKDDGSCMILTNSGKRLNMTAKEVSTMDAIAETIPYSPKLSDKELATIFPEARGYLVDKNKELKAELVTLKDRELEIDAGYNKISERTLKWLLDAWNSTEQDHTKKQMEKNDSILLHIKMNAGYKPRKKKGKVDIQAIKQTPITNYVQFRRDHKALCVFHKDNDPSMHYYKDQNRVHCFACGQGGDVIDVVMAIFNLDKNNKEDWIKAVNIIQGR